MSRNDSASRNRGTLKSRCGVQIPKDCYAPIAYKCIVIENCYYRTLTVSVREGMGERVFLNNS